jgi:hypothetical protein
MNNRRTDEGAASMVLGIIPVVTVTCQTATKRRTLATGRTRRTRGVLTFTASYAIATHFFLDDVSFLFSG